MARQKICLGQKSARPLREFSSFGLRPASGESGAKGGGDRQRNGAEAERPADEPQTEAFRHCVKLERMPVRDERRFLRRRTGAVERHTGRPAARKTERKPALVTAIGV